MDKRFFLSLMVAIHPVRIYISSHFFIHLFVMCVKIIIIIRLLIKVTNA